jgi:hypothetical protein
LTITPKLTFNTSLSGIDHYFGIKVKNNGIGPAIVKKFLIIVDGVLLSTETNAGWNATLEKLGLNKIEVVWCGLESDEAMGVGSTQNILLLPENYWSPERIVILKTAMKRLRIIIEYESVYKEQFIVEWKYSDNLVM